MTKKGLSHPSTGSSIYWLSLSWLTKKKKKKKTSFTSYKPQYANTKIVYCADAMTPFVQLPVLPKPKLQESNRRFQNKGSKIKPFH